MPIRVLALVGSLRSGSHNRQLAQAAGKLAPEGVEIDIHEGLADVPLYNEDIDVEGSVPAAAARLREAADGADAFLLLSPEHNGTLPAALKNAIDWCSRPRGSAALAGKPAAVIGASAGRFGGARAHDDARRALGVAGAVVLEHAPLAIPGSRARFADVQPVQDAEVTEQLPAIIEQLAAAATEAAAS